MALGISPMAPNALCPPGGLCSRGKRPDLMEKTRLVHFPKTVTRSYLACPLGIVCSRLCGNGSYSHGDSGRKASSVSS